MKRIMIFVTTLGLVAGACSNGDSDESAATTAAATNVVETVDQATDDPDEASADETVSTTEPSADETVSTTEPSADEGDDSTTEEPTADDTGDESNDSDTAEESDDGASSGDDDSGDDDSGDDDSDDDSADDGDSAGSGTPISSISDIPEICRELTADFLREIEPIVSPIDWQTASMSDFEAIGAEFEAKSAEFEAAGEADGCNDLEFVGDSEFDLMVDFARDEAPGSVGFLEFIGNITAAVPGADGSDDDGSTGGDDALETCDDAVAFVQNLIDTYDGASEVPATALVEFQGLPALLPTCSREQSEFFQSPEVIAFFGQ